MGTTDNFDTPAFAGPVTATTTLPVISSATGRGATANGNHFVAVTGRTKIFNCSGNIGTLASFGTSTTVVANTMYFSDIYIPDTGHVCTGAGWLNGTTATTNKTIVTLYNSAGTLLANSVVTGGGTLVATSNIFQQVAFTAPYTTFVPGRYWLGYMQDGTTATPRTIATATWVDVMTGSVAGVAATATPSITPATSFTADTGPLMYIYT
jgi:hypothetical protein